MAFINYCIIFVRFKKDITAETPSKRIHKNTYKSEKKKEKLVSSKSGLNKNQINTKSPQALGSISNVSSVSGVEYQKLKSSKSKQHQASESTLPSSLPPTTLVNTKQKNSSIEWTQIEKNSSRSADYVYPSAESEKENHSAFALIGNYTSGSESSSPPVKASENRKNNSSKPIEIGKNSSQFQSVSQRPVEPSENRNNISFESAKVDMLSTSDSDIGSSPAKPENRWKKTFESTQIGSNLSESESAVSLSSSEKSASSIEELSDEHLTKST